MKKYCFIVGSSRSGTTYLNRMLGAHPDVVGGTETHLMVFLSKMRDVYDDYQALQHSQIGLHNWIDRSSYQRELRDFFERITFRQKDPDERGLVYLEKTPDNSRYLPCIDALFEDVLVIHLIRNPMEVVDSLLRASRGWGKQWAPDSVRKATKIWIRNVGRACRDGRRMGEGRYRELAYSQLQQQPNRLLADLFERLGLDSDDALIEACVEAANNTSDLPEGFVSAHSDRHSLSCWSEWYVRRKTKPLIESYGLQFET